jgi:hypothetical protein
MNFPEEEQQPLALMQYMNMYGIKPMTHESKCQLEIPDELHCVHCLRLTRSHYEDVHLAKINVPNSLPLVG